ncbi:MAG: CvpA family protein [Eubacteriales bacterium]|nr:CvpA family protein [Eubacteriales bacterium]
MNLLMIIVVLIFAIFTLRGYRRGFIGSLASVVSLVVSLALVSFATPYVADFLENRTGIYTYVEQMCQNNFSIDQEKNAGKMAGEENSPESSGTELDEKTAENQLIRGLPLPKMLQNLLINNNTAQTYRDLAVNNLQQYVAKFMSNLIMSVLAFIITWILTVIALRIIILLLNQIAELPGIHGVNHLLGTAVGFIQGLVIVWLAFLIITIFGNTEAGQQILKMISENRFLRMLYESNILLDFLQNITKNIF